MKEKGQRLVPGFKCHQKGAQWALGNRPAARKMENERESERSDRQPGRLEEEKQDT